MNGDELYNLIILNYYVLFKTEHVDKGYKPIVPINTYEASNTTHLWDKELDPIIPALWYILHLPRMGFDVIENDMELVLHSHDEPHNIIPFPYCIKDNEFQRFINNHLVNPTLIICPDEVYEDVILDNSIPKSMLGICRISDLTTELLQTHWKKLSSIVQKYLSDSKECVIDPSFRLTTNNGRKILPLIPLANQLGYTKQLVDKIETLNSNNNSYKYVLAMRKRILDTYRIMIQKDTKFKDRTEKTLIESSNFNGVPLVITMPGIMQYQVKITGRVDQLPDNEKEMINILGNHRAMAKNALYIDLDSVSQEMFTELAALEEHCKGENKINNIFIWRTLRRIGRLIHNKIQKFDIDIIEYVSQITVFSDFPIGLAILPNCSAPLCCIKPISYRPLTPLTKAFQYEINKSPQVYFGKKLKVVVAECVNKSDDIRKYCDALSRNLENMVKNYLEVELVVEEILSIEQFKRTLQKHHDAHILLISAHGNYQIKNNKAGLVIGNSVWMADDNDIVLPPVVLLSACHVMPRGRGVVTVGDMLIRSGAKAVLGTFIPVDVRRNATLIVRLFTSILEVRKGWSHMRTLDEIWCHVICTNALHEIIGPISKKDSKLEIWANTKKDDETFPNAEFKNKYSVGRLRSTHVYEDTENILREIAYRDGIGDYYDSYIKSNSYFPESLFYQFIGTPENIFIRNSVMEAWHNMNK